jgi:hypothetical protein
VHAFVNDLEPLTVGGRQARPPDHVWLDLELRESAASRAAWPTSATGQAPGRVKRAPYRSEHHDLDVLAGEDGSYGGQGVALDQEVLGQGMDVAQAALQWTVGIDRRSCRRRRDRRWRGW